MRVLHVSWEYPPIVYGGLGRHVQALTRAQAERGDDVTVLTQTADREPSVEVVDGIRVIRAPHDPPDVPFSEETLLAWVMGMETGMIRAGADSGPVDVVHAHDWVTSHAAIALREIIDARALVATIHATEAGRHQGWLPSPLSDAVHSIEHWLVHEADRVITCSQHMRREVEQLFAAPSDRISVIANGIDLERWRARRAGVARARDAHAPTGPLVVFVGRLEWEKGAHTLIEALPRLRRRLPGLRAVIAGRGGHADELEQQVRARRLSRAVDFVGWLPDAELHGLIAAADVLVVPSLYEPFGLVALEGAALGAPLVVARTGGLAEFIEDGKTGRVFEPGDASGLADAVTAAIRNPEGSRRMAEAARSSLRDAYGWSLVAAQTAVAYDNALAESHPRVSAPPARLAGRSVNLLRS
jgi:glycogen(starch) synthase